MLNYALMNCMNCGRKFDESVEGYAEFLPEENHWEAECGKCCAHYEMSNNEPVVTQQDIEILRALFVEDPFVDINDSDLPF